MRAGIMPAMGDVRHFEMNLTTRDGVSHRIKFVFDLALESHQHIYGCIAFNRLYEAGTSAILIDQLRPGDVFIDVGAHIGYFTLLASALVGPAGCVHSFEPEQRNHAALLNHLKLNGTSNVLPYPWALSDMTGITELFVHPHHDGAHSIWDIKPRLYEKDRDKITRTPVFATSLDTLLSDPIPLSIRAIKIDVEGFEMHVVRGMSRVLDSARVPVVIIEINESLLTECKTSEQELRDFLVRRGYSILADDPETGKLIKLEPAQPFKSKFVYNLIFVRQ